MAAGIVGVFDEDLRNAIVNSKVLVVGAGGIGCELLKNLVLTGFNDIEIIDLDTIDVSNLNRQFLFHKQHVGKSKAAVARESALKFNPNVSIKHYHDSIIGSDYNINFFKRFSLVMNALDNRTARNHVNRMCLAANVPLIESGTAGYDGQVELIKKSLTRCYECEPKAAQKTFPGCTIRNTPSEPIHCIVWSKHLFNQLFGEADADQDVSPDTEDPEAAADAGENALNKEPMDLSESNGNIDRKSTRVWAEECDYDPKKLFCKFFRDDINYLLSMDKLWTKRRPPTPLNWDELPDAVASTSQSEDPGLKDLKTWSIAECAKIFASSIESLKAELKKLTEGDHLVWDKDNKASMDFVAACANIRAHIFGIPQKTRFDIKSMAGNIIPAIATTNAIIAGVVVLRAFRVLQDELAKCQTVYLRLKPNHRKQILVPEKYLIPPKENCYICSEKPEVTILVNVNKMTVKELEETVLKKGLNMAAPDVILDSTGMVVISSEEDETECNNEKTLSEMGIRDGCLLKIDDFLQNYELSAYINHYEAGKDEPEFKIIADPSQLKPKEEEEGGETQEENKENKSDHADMEDDIIFVDEESSPSGKKRKLDDDDAGDSVQTYESNEPVNNYQKSMQGEEENYEDDIILLDDFSPSGRKRKLSDSTRDSGQNYKPTPLQNELKAQDYSYDCIDVDEDIICIDEEYSHSEKRRKFDESHNYESNHSEKSRRQDLSKTDGDIILLDEDCCRTRQKNECFNSADECHIRSLADSDGIGSAAAAAAVTEPDRTVVDVGPALSLNERRQDSVERSGEVVLVGHLSGQKRKWNDVDDEDVDSMAATPPKKRKKPGDDEPDCNDVDDDDDDDGDDYADDGGDSDIVIL